MSRHDDQPRLRHMLDHARGSGRNGPGQDPRGPLDTDRQLNLALVRLLEIVGEAAARISDETRERYPDIPWPEIVSLRNRLIHGYDEVDFEILWEIIRSDLPGLILELERILKLAIVAFGGTRRLRTEPHRLRENIANDATPAG